MDSEKKAERVLANIRFCPICGGNLEPHPLAEGTKSCFPHGDFFTEWGDSSPSQRVVIFNGMVEL